ncbi:hypothetical protein [Streptomyces sp. NPDC059072]
MSILRRFFSSPPAPVPPQSTPPTPGEADDGMGESWAWEPGDLDDEETVR